MKRALVVAGLACLLLAAGLGWSWSQWTQRWPTGPRYVTQRVRVPSGMSAAALADTLAPAACCVTVWCCWRAPG